MTETPRRDAGMDVLRGLVIVLMALDHVRDFVQPQGLLPTDLSTTSPAFFAMRWVTHLCAPVFVLLMGAGAALRHRKKPDESVAFLLSRGLWIILLELTWVSWSWSWDLGRSHLGVLWAIGGSMVLLAPLARLSERAHLGLGLGLTGVLAVLPVAWQRPWGEGLLQPGSWTVGGHPLNITYALVPWFAVALVGWGLGGWLVSAPRKHLGALGAGLVALFFALRLGGLGDPVPWQVQERGPVFTALDVLRVSKYPPSLDYLLLTLGVGLGLLALARGTGPVGRWLVRLGRVPMFFYLAHLPLAHALGNVVNLTLYGVPLAPAEAPLSLVRILLVWGLLVAVLTPVCTAWGRLKERRRDLRWLACL